MKKVLVVLMALTLGAGFAFASSLSVPWFVDTGPAANKLPPATAGVTALVYLHNNLASEITCSIAYFTATGVPIGPAAPNNTFVIAANASLAFRPVASDPASAAGGQENPDSGWLVPDRPMGTAGGNDDKKNGSLVVEWLGGAGDVQGVYLQEQLPGTAASTNWVVYGHLLPPGV